MELLGFDKVLDEINKLFRTKLCPNTMGQVHALYHVCLYISACTLNIL